MPTNDLLLAFFDNIGQNATVTGSFVAATGYPLSNLKTPVLTDKARTQDLTANVYLQFDQGSIISADIFALIGSNATNAATRRFRAADDAAFTVNVIESGSGLDPAVNTDLISSRVVYVAPWGRVLIYTHPIVFAKRYMRWHQSDTTNPDGYQEWSVARVGRSLQYPIDGWTPSPVRYGVSGNETFLREHEFSLGLLTKAQTYELQDLVLSSGGSQRILVIPEGTTPSTYHFDAIWGVFNLERGVYTRQVVADTTFSDRRYKSTIWVREVCV